MLASVVALPLRSANTSCAHLKLFGTAEVFLQTEMDYSSSVPSWPVRAQGGTCVQSLMLVLKTGWDFLRLRYFQHNKGTERCRRGDLGTVTGLQVPS